MTKHIELKVKVSRIGKSSPEPTYEQLCLFGLPPVPIPPVKKKITIKVYRPTAKLVARYHGLADITPEEWSEFFPKNAKEWTDEDRDYLVAWWGKDDTMSLAYALGRPPWNLQREICRLRREGHDIEYLRLDGEGGGE